MTTKNERNKILAESPRLLNACRAVFFSITIEGIVVALKLVEMMLGTTIDAKAPWKIVTLPLNNNMSIGILINPLIAKMTRIW